MHSKHQSVCDVWFVLINHADTYNITAYNDTGKYVSWVRLGIPSLHGN